MTGPAPTDLGVVFKVVVDLPAHGLRAGDRIMPGPPVLHIKRRNGLTFEALAHLADQQAIVGLTPAMVRELEAVEALLDESAKAVSIRRGHLCLLR